MKEKKGRWKEAKNVMYQILDGKLIHQIQFLYEDIYLLAPLSLSFPQRHTHNTHTHTHSLSLSHSHSYTHTHTHTYKVFLFPTFLLSL